MFGKSPNVEFQCSEKPKFRIPMFGKEKIQNSNLRKRKNLEFQCLKKLNFQNSNVWKKPKFRIPMFGKAKIQNSNVWKN